MKHSRHLVPTSFCPINLLLMVSGLAGSANMTPRAGTLFSCETSHSWWAWEGAARIPPSVLKIDSICVIFGIFCSLWARETSPHKHKRRKSPMETSWTTKATSYIICLLGNTYIVSLQFHSDPELVGVEVCVLEHFFKSLLVLREGQRQGWAADTSGSQECHELWEQLSFWRGWQNTGNTWPTQAEPSLLSSHFRCQSHNPKVFEIKRWQLYSYKGTYNCTESATGYKEQKYYKSLGAAKLANSDVVLWSQTLTELTISLLIALLGILVIHQSCMYPSHPDTGPFKRMFYKKSRSMFSTCFNNHEKTVSYL